MNLPCTTPNIQEIEIMTNFCKTLATAPFYQKMGAGGILAIYLTAKELNLPLMSCLNGGLYTFDGKVTMSAQLMNMMIVNSGHRADVLKLDETGCWIRFWRKDRKEGYGDKFEYSFTLDQAVKAGYMSKANWKAHPKDMFYSRCLSGGARKFMPDVLMNAYVFNEIEDASFSDAHMVNVMPQIEIVESPKELEDQTIANIERITHEQIMCIKNLIEKHSKPNDIEDKLLKKHNTYETIPIEKYDSIIKHIMALLKLDEQIREQSISVKPDQEIIIEEKN